MPRIILLINRFFPLWAISLAGVAYVYPAPFISLKPAIVPLLAVIMLGMGLTLTPADFHRILRRPGIIALGVILQYSIMPLAAFLTARTLQLGPELTVGMVLVGSSAGGTASNVICYLARGNVALSITLTLASTLVAVLAMPALSWLYLHRIVPVPVWDMLQDILLIVVMPVLAGVLVNSRLHSQLHAARPYFPLLSTLSIILIIAIITALNRGNLAQVGPVLVLGVAVHNLLGLSAGYLLPKLLGYGRETCRTLAIEVGMQNSGLSASLASQYFSTLAALPAALFSIWHNLSGALLAAIWSNTGFTARQQGNHRPPEAS